MEYDIMIVDKKELTRDTLKRIFEGVGYSVDTAEDGRESLQKMRSNKYSYGVVITEIIMSYAGGFEVIETVKEESSVPVIVLSAVSDARTIKESFRLNADDFMRKPFDADILLKRVSTLLGKNKIWSSQPHSGRVRSIQYANNDMDKSTRKNVQESPVNYSQSK
jgi:DNA-binding response OmpR family regulator